MDQYEYKYVSNVFSPRWVLRQVEEHESNGWTLYQLETGFVALFGCGGTTGMTAVLRRTRAANSGSSGT